jgi:hypothetical protein
LPVAVISPNAPWPSLPTDQQLKVRPLHHNNHNHNNFYSESSSAHSSLQSAGQHNTRPLLLTDGQHRASWANLLVDIVDSRFNKTPSKSVAEIGNGGKLGFLQPTTFDAPPPYDQLHGNHVVGGQQLGAYRQYSNASAGTETSSGPFSVVSSLALPWHFCIHLSSKTPFFSPKAPTLSSTSDSASPAATTFPWARPDLPPPSPSRPWPPHSAPALPSVPEAIRAAAAAPRLGPAPHADRCKRAAEPLTTNEIECKNCAICGLVRAAVSAVCCFFSSSLGSSSLPVGLKTFRKL